MRGPLTREKLNANYRLKHPRSKHPSTHPPPLFLSIPPNGDFSPIRNYGAGTGSSIKSLGLKMCPLCARNYVHGRDNLPRSQEDRLLSISRYIRLMKEILRIHLLPVYICECRISLSLFLYICKSMFRERVCVCVCYRTIVFKNFRKRARSKEPPTYVPLLS